MVSFFWLCHTTLFSFLAKDQLVPHGVEAWSPNHWVTREFLVIWSFKKYWSFQSKNMVYLSICLCHLYFPSSPFYSFQSTGLLPPYVDLFLCIMDKLLFIHLLNGQWFASTYLLLWILMLWTQCTNICSSFCFHFLAMYFEVEFLDHMQILFNFLKCLSHHFLQWSHH